MVRKTPYDIGLRAPFSLVLAGVSGSGKTHFCVELLKNASGIMEKPPSRVIYFYNQWSSPLFDELQRLHLVHEFVQGNPTMDQVREICSEHSNALFIIDDLALQTNLDTAELFTVGRSKLDCNIIFMTQNLFERSGVFRTLSINSSAICIFKMIRDKTTILNFAKQFAPGNTRWLLDAYKHATQQPYTYLFFDMHQRSSDEVRVLANLFDENSPISAYRANT